MDAYDQQNCTVHGVHYPHQKIDDISYKTGTRVYQVSNTTDHFPRSDHIFGRWVRIIYDGQPDQRRRPTDETGDDQEQMDTHNEPVIENPSTIQEKPLSQMPEPSNHQTTATGQPNGASLPVIVELNSRTIVAETPPEKLPTTTETTTKMTPHPTMDLTIEELPTLPSRAPATKLEIQETPDIDEFSDDSMEQSPTVMNKSIQTTFKRPRYLTSESEENLNTTQLNLEQRNAAVKAQLQFQGR